MSTFRYIEEIDQISRALKEFKECFPDLVERVGNIDQYVKKLSMLAHVVVMRNKEENIGLCCYYDNDKRLLSGYISLIGVKNKYQGLGNGSKLLSFVQDELRKFGMKQVKLEVEFDNEKAMALYRRFGFQILGKARENSCYMGTDLHK